MKPLGICWIAYGTLRVAIGIAQIVFAPTATVMFGALLGRVPDPYTLMGIFHAAYVVAIVMSLVCGVLGLAGGLALALNSRSRRGMLIVASLLALSDLPVGVALGAYTLILLLPASSKENIQTK